MKLSILICKLVLNKTIQFFPSTVVFELIAGSIGAAFAALCLGVPVIGALLLSGLAGVLILYLAGEQVALDFRLVRDGGYFTTEWGEKLTF